MMRHIRLRSFPTQCRFCHGAVLYWESTSGAKVFFDLPIYGRPFKHYCKSPKKKHQSIQKFQDALLSHANRLTFQCPVCGKIVPDEESLNIHIKTLKKIDDIHDRFFNDALDLVSWEEVEDSEQTQSDLSNYHTQHPLFTQDDRFILKAKFNADKKPFENLLRRAKK
jgi:hypothetical protein